jgi:hypothetical protein
MLPVCHKTASSFDERERALWYGSSLSRRRWRIGPAERSWVNCGSWHGLVLHRSIAPFRAREPAGPGTPCCLPFARLGPCGPGPPCSLFPPCGPGGPCSPFAPCGPAGPYAPAGPCAHAGPSGPFEHPASAKAATREVIVMERRIVSPKKFFRSKRFHRRMALSKRQV